MKQDTALDENLNNVWRLFSLPVSMRNWFFFFSYEYLKSVSNTANIVLREIQAAHSFYYI